MAPGHPRTCGAALLAVLVGPKKYGSSPHLRGSLRLPAHLEREERVIPAPAGQPVEIRLPQGETVGHPRTCGAAYPTYPGYESEYGSSPHLRGSPSQRSLAPGRGRVIPAPAGQPMSLSARSYGSPGHPRTCGAAIFQSNGNDLGEGSSPHLRGSPRAELLDAVLQRVIPAPAGQPQTQGESARQVWGHPRTCGAARSAPWRYVAQRQSSPHLRGSQFRWETPKDACRVIPAPAGQPCHHPYTTLPGRGHPRTCGAAKETTKWQR